MGNHNTSNESETKQDKSDNKLQQYIFDGEPVWYQFQSEYSETNIHTGRSHLSCLTRG